MKRSEKQDAILRRRDAKAFAPEQRFCFIVRIFFILSLGIISFKQVPAIYSGDKLAAVAAYFVFFHFSDAQDHLIVPGRKAINDCFCR